MNELINYGGDCRTAPATPGLLKIDKTAVVLLLTVVIRIFETIILPWIILPWIILPLIFLVLILW